MPETNPPAQDPFTSEGSPTLQMLVEHFVELLTDPKTLARLETTLANAGAKAGGIAEGAAGYVTEHIVKALAVPLARVIGGVLVGILNAGEPLYDDLGKIAVDSLLGARVRPRSIPDDVGARILERLAPAGGVVTPGISGAQNYLTMMTHLNVESWALGVFAELFGEASEILTHSGGALESVAELREMVIQIMGGGRIMRRVLAPFIDDGIVQPAKRWTALKYRPALLGVSTAIAAYQRGQMPLEAMQQECAQQGYSDERISMLVEDARKRLTLADLFWRHYRGELSDADVAREARALGYDEGTSQELLAIDDQKRADALKAPIIAEAVSNYLSGDISELKMIEAVNGAAPNQAEAQRIIGTAKDRRPLHVTRITPGEFKALVKDGIQTNADYRVYLESRGYPPDDVDLLDLQLRVELQKQKDVATARAHQQADKIAKDAAAAAAKAARDADVAAKKARAQFPALSVYRTAYIHGLINQDALAAALTRDGLVNDQDLYLGDADVDRAVFLDAQAKRDKATAIAAAGGLSVAQLEQSVLDGILSIAEFDSDLLKREVADDDRAILVKLLQVRLDNRAKAEAERKAVAVRAAAKATSAADWTRAVRLGVRTVDQYRAWLRSLGTADVSIALLVDLLQQEMRDDAAAKAKRAARDAAAAKAGLQLAERRRAVIAGVRPRQWYADALARLAWPVDDQLADLDLLDVEIANAAAAKAKRDAIAAKDTGATLSLSQLESAFKLGLITQAEFRDALDARSYAAADVDLIVQLAVASLRNVRGGAAAEAGATPDQLGKPIPLADLKRSVLRGLTTSADYESQLTARGFSIDAAALMRQLIDEQVALQRDALQKKAAAAITKTDPGYTLDELLASFSAGDLDATALQAALVAGGVAADVALLLSRIVASLGAEG